MRKDDRVEIQEESFCSRTEMLLGKDGVEALSNAHVIIFGIGGVGGYAAEALVRAGVGEITAVDSDTVCNSNRNRQIIATVDSVGRFKVDVMRERILSINPDAKVHTKQLFFGKDTIGEFDWKQYSYIADAIDCVTSKILLADISHETGTPLISCMGTGNKLDPTLLRVSDISKTSVCPLARVMRTELRKRGIKKLKTVWSPEEPVLKGTQIPGSVSFVPSVAGLIMAGEIIKDISRGGCITEFSKKSSAGKGEL